MKGIQSYKNANNILGWVVFAIALIVYVLTMEKSGSFWDCGEFVAGAYKLQVVHPPGAPIFNIIGRFFTLFSFGNPKMVAVMINLLSALSTAFVVLFCYWSTTALARKMFLKDEEEYTSGNIIAVLGAGLVGALACTFLDSLWFSAAEGEVYALSMFFMTFVVWAILKWDADDSEHADRWLLLIAFMIGLSTGVHLLSMLVIPFACLIYYFKKYDFTLLGFAIAFGSSFLIIGFVMKGIMAGIPMIMSKADYLFVNVMGMGFNTGVLISGILMVAALVAGLWYTTSRNKEVLQKVLLGITFIVIGYSSFLMVPIRSNANTPINMNRPADPFSMLSYLNREQYGERPLLFGPAYNADQYDMKRDSKGAVMKTGVSKRYGKGKDKYIEIGEKFEYVFHEDAKMFFPRLGVWQDASKETAYRSWIKPDYNVYDREKRKVVSQYSNAQLEMAKAYVKEINSTNESRYGQARYVVKDDISWGDNIRFFFQYQVGFMYMRYFMWNFSGRQNDIQGKHDNHEGGWIVGIPAIDDILTLWGNPTYTQKNLSPQRLANMGHNKFFAIPFILGLIGIVFLFKKNWQLGLAVTVMFLATGIFFIIYGNQTPAEPRERDYALVGSFFTYCIWIGFGVLAIFTLLKKYVSPSAGAGIAITLGLIAPMLMGSQGWDDHNRSGRTTTIDFATNYLESCEPNAVIFTQGDNDTYPLWYAQEVEGVRTDIRIVNLSLIGVDWYIDQLRYKMNDADPIKLTFTPEQIKGDNRNYVQFRKMPKADDTKFYDAQQIMKFVARDDEKVAAQLNGDGYFTPTRKLSFPITSNSAALDGLGEVDSSIARVNALEVRLSKANWSKNDLMTIDLIANNINDRPIYFAVSVSPSAYLGFEKYFKQEGLTYRIVPEQNKGGSAQKAPVNTDVMYDNMMNDFKWGQIPENPNIYIDENISRMTLNLVSNFSKLATQLLNDGETEKAVEALDKCIASLPGDKIPYSYFHSEIPKLYLAAGEKEKADALATEYLESAKGELDYYLEVYSNQVEWARKNNPGYLQKLQNGAFTQSRDISEQLYLLQVTAINMKDESPDLAATIETAFTEYQALFRNVN